MNRSLWVSFGFPALKCQLFLEFTSPHTENQATSDRRTNCGSTFLSCTDWWNQLQKFCLVTGSCFSKHILPVSICCIALNSWLRNVLPEQIKQWFMAELCMGDCCYCMRAASESHASCVRYCRLLDKQEMVLSVVLPPSSGWRWKQSFCAKCW
jgi:hypothetical protein